MLQPVFARCEAIKRNDLIAYSDLSENEMNNLHLAHSHWCYVVGLLFASLRMTGLPCGMEHQ